MGTEASQYTLCIKIVTCRDGAILDKTFPVPDETAWFTYTFQQIIDKWIIFKIGYYARFTLADPTPRLCPDAVGSANVNGFPTRNRLSGPHQETIGRSSGNIKHV